jgi:hypothetical protein
VRSTENERRVGESIESLPILSHNVVDGSLESKMAT